MKAASRWQDKVAKPKAGRKARGEGPQFQSHQTGRGRAAFVILCGQNDGQQGQEPSLCGDMALGSEMNEGLLNSFCQAFIAELLGPGWLNPRKVSALPCLVLGWSSRGTAYH